MKINKKIYRSPPIKYTEKATGGARLISSSISPGGNIVLMGDTHQAVILYRVYEQHVERITELEAHSVISYDRLIL